MKVSVFLKLISLVEAGFNLYELAQEASAREAAGATDEDISKWIDGLFQKSFEELNETA